jgi:hypothetical protein
MDKDAEGSIPIDTFSYKSDDERGSKCWSRLDSKLCIRTGGIIMRKIIMTGLVGVLAVIFASTLAEAAGAPYTTSVKLTCDNAVTLGSAIGVRLCNDTDCGLFTEVGDIECGTTISVRSAGGRFESVDFEPRVLRFTLLQGFYETGETCSLESTNANNPYLFMQMGSTVACGDFRSPKLSVGRPH